MLLVHNVFFPFDIQHFILTHQEVNEITALCFNWGHWCCGIFVVFLFFYSVLRLSVPHPKAAWVICLCQSRRVRDTHWNGCAQEKSVFWIISCLVTFITPHYSWITVHILGFVWSQHHLNCSSITRVFISFLSTHTLFNVHFCLP